MSVANEKQVGGDHYARGNFQTWDFIELAELGFLEGNVIKYLTRWERKGTPKQDLEKAEHYLQKLVEEAKQGRRPRGFARNNELEDYLHAQNLTGPTAKAIALVSQWRDFNDLNWAMERVRILIIRQVAFEANEDTKDIFGDGN